MIKGLKFTVLFVPIALFLMTNQGFAESNKDVASLQEVTQNQISEAQAKEIALKQVEGTLVKVELDTENGVLVYEVDVKTDKGIYEVEIDAKSGKVLKVEKEND